MTINKDWNWVGDRNAARVAAATVYYTVAGNKDDATALLADVDPDEYPAVIAALAGMASGFLTAGFAKGEMPIGDADAAAASYMRTVCLGLASPDGAGR